MNVIPSPRVRSKLFICLLYPLSLLFASCGEDSGTSSPPTPTVTKGTISGKLLSKENNKPIRGADIILLPSSTYATTLSDGSFSFANVPAGTYSLAVDWTDRGSGTVSGIKVIAGQTTSAPLFLSCPIGNWSLTVTFTTTRTYQLDFFEDLTYEIRGLINQNGTWRVRDERLTMDATTGNDTWSGWYDPSVMTGTVLSVGKTGTWTAVR
jgi:hypothetical protein